MTNKHCGLKREIDLGKASRKNVAVLLDFVQMRGGGPAQIFCHLFISAFLVNKRSLFPPKCQLFELEQQLLFRETFSNELIR